VPKSEIADFDEVAQCLAALGAAWEPAEAHGAFCGMACCSGSAALVDWLRELAPEAAAGDVLAAERRSLLQRVAADTLLKLEAGQLAFELLLPASGSPVAARTAALAHWCHGFMHGLMTAGNPDTGRHGESLDSDVVREILEDFSAITRVATDADTGDEADAALAELNEYVRVAVQLIYEETHSLRAGRAAAVRPAASQEVH
jgi:uncharacterized protein YgfB (UPF0149 family)